MNIKQIKQKLLSGKETEVKGKCYFCGKEVNGMFWCFGCHHFICEECDTSEGEAMGKHSINDHRV